MEATTSRTQIPTAMLRENLEIMRHELTLSARALAILEDGDAEQAERTCPCCGATMSAGAARRLTTNGKAMRRTTAGRKTAGRKTTRRTTGRKPAGRRPRQPEEALTAA